MVLKVESRTCKKLRQDEKEAAAAQQQQTNHFFISKFICMSKAEMKWYKNLNFFTTLAPVRSPSKRFSSIFLWWLDFDTDWISIDINQMAMAIYSASILQSCKHWLWKTDICYWCITYFGYSDASRYFKRGIISVFLVLMS